MTILSSLLLASSVLPQAAPVAEEAVADSEQVVVLSELEALGFAEMLFQEGDYYRAITEYKRAMFLCDIPAVRVDANTRIGQSLFLAGQYGLLEGWFQESAETGLLTEEGSILYGRSLYRAGRFREAADYFSGVDSVLEDRSEVAQARFYQGLSRVRSEEYSGAMECFRAVPENSAYFQRAGVFSELLEGAPGYGRKSPVLASILGILPGLGYAYCEHYGTAAASLVLNGLLGWATYDAFKDGDTAEGITVSIFAAGFYLGNIVGSAQSAGRYNRYRSELFQDQFYE